MFSPGTWVKINGTAPEKYQGAWGRIFIPANHYKAHFLQRQKLGYWVNLKMANADTLTRQGLPATWLEASEMPPPEIAVLWMVEKMRDG